MWACSGYLWRYLGVSALLVGVARIHAQPVCAIDIGPDQTICQGESVTLTAPPGFSSYLWNTGSNQQSITVGAGGVYSAQVSYPSGELVFNGNFSQGNVGFTTEFTLNSNLNLGDGYYWIGTNAASHHPQFLGTGSGQFMMVNSGWLSALFLVWCQEVQVCPGQTYTLSYRARTLSNAAPARLQWWINGVPSGPEVTLPNFSQGWQTINHTWTSPAVLTTANICLRAMSGDGIGNDFGLDDISMQGTIVLTDAMTLTVTPLPPVDLGPDVTLCQGESLILDAGVAGGSYLWQDGSTGPGYVVNGPGSYSVTVTANNCSASDQITVNYNPLPPVDLGPDVTLCTGETLVLDVTTPGATYAWQNGSTGPTFTVTGPGQYSVSVTVGGCTSSDAIQVGQAPLPVVDLGSDQTLCAGQSVLLNATLPGATYLWQDGSTGPIFNANTSGTYSVTVTLGGCSASDAVDLLFNPLPAVDLGPDLSVCPGTTVVLDATVPGGSYLWSTGAQTPTIAVDQPGGYSVTVTANGCQASDAVTITHQALAPVDLGPDVTLCAGGTVVLDATVPGASYLWSTGAQTPTITVGTNGTYSVTVTQGSCTVDASVQVTVLPVPQVDLGSDLTLCPGATALLDATVPGASYLWNTGAQTPTIQVTQGGTYSVTVTNAAGCSSTDAVSVVYVTADAVDLGPDLSLCQGETITLDATLPGSSYLWSTGTMTPTITVGTAGTYWVQVTQGPCSVSDTVHIAVVAPGSLDLGPDISICAGSSVVLDATLPGASYLWSTGATSATITVSAAGNYSVTATVQGCSTSDAINVSVTPLPVVDIGGDQSLCPGSMVVFDATTQGGTYLWHDGTTGPTYTTGSAGAVSVTVTVNGCSASAGASVIAVEGPVVALGADTTLCENASLSLDVTQPGASYLWDNGSTSGTRTITAAGTYWVQVERNGCIAEDTIQVAVFSAAAIDLGAPFTLCAGQTATLSVQAPGASLLWNTGATSSSIVIDQGGTYWVQASVAACTASDTVVVHMPLVPQPDLGPEVKACAGDTVELVVDAAGAAILWSNGSDAPSIAVNSGGTYTVTLTVDGCGLSDAVLVDFLPFIDSIDLGPDRILCPGATAVLNASLGGDATYLWSNGSTSPAINTTQSGVYTVTATGTCVDAEGQVELIAGDCGPAVHVPNAFTPDDDGVNDLFLPVVAGDVESYRLEIFDRWGEMIFNANDPTIGWDGTYGGIPVADGVYVWRLVYRAVTDLGAVNEQFMGHLTLIR